MLAGHLRLHGNPVACYSGKRSVCRVAKAAANSGHQATRSGREILELSIGIPYANSSLAKGRVWRKNRTLQDRLVKQMRLDNTAGMAVDNDWLPGHIQRRKPAACPNPCPPRHPVLAG